MLMTRWLWLGLLPLLAAGCASQPTPAPRPVRQPINLAVVREALSLKGIAYRWGEESPQRGFDCSGLVQYVYGRHGIALPRTAYQMAMALPTLDSRQRQPGDLVSVVDSEGYIEIAVVNGSAAARLDARLGDSVEVVL